MTRASGALNAGVTLGNVTIFGGGNLMGDISHSASDPRVYGAFLTSRIVRVAKVLRFEATAQYSDASSIRMGTGSGGAGLTLLDDRFDVSVYYRRAELLYTALGGFVHHDAVGGMLVVTPHPTMMFALQGEGTGGSDVNSLFIYGSALWRPRF